MAAGGSAQSRAEDLRAQAARARTRADALEHQAGAWAAGADGERRVAALLSRLPGGWYVHHDRLLRPGRGQTNLDHIVVGPSGVYLIDTKNWAGGSSVHEGNLWQHTHSSSPKGRELDTVSRFAGEMEKGLGLPVVPVIALAGSGASSFTRQRVRGVEIVPQDELVGWLLAQPAPCDRPGQELLSRRVAHMYPSASAEPDDADGTTPLTVEDIVGTEPPSVRKASGSHDARTIKRAPATRTRRRRRRRRGSTVSALVGIVALMAFSQLAPRIVAQLLNRSALAPSSPLVGPRPTRLTTSKNCHALTTATIQKITGSKAVLEKPQPGDDSCTWWLAKPRYSTQGADVTLVMGQTSRVRFAATGTTEARIDMMHGEVSAWLPENTSLGGGRTSTRARQPFVITLRFTYPPGVSQKGALAVEATAAGKVTDLAEALATLLPEDHRT